MRSLTTEGLPHNGNLHADARLCDIDRVPGWSFVDVPAPRRPQAEPETELRGLPLTSNVQGLFRKADGAYLGTVVFKDGRYYAVAVGYGQLPGSHLDEDGACDALLDHERQDGERWDSCS